MFKKRLALILSFFLLIASSALVAGSLVPRQSAHAVKFSGNAATTTPTPTGTPTTGTAAADSFQRTTVGANSQERAYLSSFTIQDVDVVEKVVLPRCSGSTTNCDAFVIGRYAPVYYRVGVVQGAGRADIFLRAQRSDGTSLGSDLDTGLPAADGAVVWLHVEFQG
jgi:hypothetical protein